MLESQERLGGKGGVPEGAAGALPTAHISLALVTPSLDCSVEILRKQRIPVLI